MAYEFRLEPDDGKHLVSLEFAVYHVLFPALSRADPPLLQQLKRFRGPHAHVKVAADQVIFALEEVDAIRAVLPKDAAEARRFLDELQALLEAAQKTKRGVRGGQK